MADVVKATFYKKLVDPNTGAIVGNVPVAPMTLASHVIMSNGNSVESAISNARGYVSYQTKAASLTDYNAGLIPAGTLAVIDD